MALVAGIDSSTQATKVEIRDADSGSLVSSGRAPHPPTSPPRSEQDPESWWTALQAAWSDAGSPTVEAISVAGQQHGMVVTDELGTPLRPAKLWNDTETAADASWLIKKLGSTGAWAEAVGSVPVASFTITKLSWLHRTEADVWARMARVCLPHDWLTWRLTGRLATDRGDASGTGYWSPARRRVSLRPPRDRRRRRRLAVGRASRPGTGRARRAMGRRRRRAGRRVRDGRQHGRGARSRVSVRARSRCHSGPRAPRTSSAIGPLLTRPAQSPGSRTRPAASSRSCARSTRRR